MSADLAVPRWILVIPYKGAPEGKSRLAEGFAEGERAELARAFLHDVLRTCAETPGVARVLVVTNRGVDAAGGGSGLLLDVVPDPGGGLNAAVRTGAEEARRLDAGAGVAVLTGDLPLLTAADLAAGLRLSSRYPLAVVPDAAGSGTTMLTAAPGRKLAPSFGAGSLARHVSSGHTRIDLSADSTLRFDVDTPAELERAAGRRELGPATRHALRGRGAPGEADSGSDEVGPVSGEAGPGSDEVGPVSGEASSGSDEVGPVSGEASSGSDEMGSVSDGVRPGRGVVGGS